MRSWTHLKRLASAGERVLEEKSASYYMNLLRKFLRQPTKFSTRPMRFDRSQERNKVSHRRHVLLEGVEVVWWSKCEEEEGEEEESEEEEYVEVEEFELKPELGEPEPKPWGTCGIANPSTY